MANGTQRSFFSSMILILETAAAFIFEGKLMDGEALIGIHPKPQRSKIYIFKVQQGSSINKNLCFGMLGPRSKRRGYVRSRVKRSR